MEDNNKLVNYESAEQDESSGYLINIQGGGKNRQVNISSFMFNFGVLSFVVGIFILIGACGFSVYSYLNQQQGIEALNDSQRANEMQQEQLLNISRKATALSETLQNLAQQEEELRIQAGLYKPALEDKIPEPENFDAESGETVLYDSEKLQQEEELPAIGETPVVIEENSDEGTTVFDVDESGGQGGPLEDLTIADISEALDVIEQRMGIRVSSLDDFQRELKIKREQMYSVAAVPEFAPDMIVIDEGYVASPTVTLDLGRFSGTPSANPNMPSIWPTTGVVSSPYGLRWGGTDFHPGIDIADEMGTPIVATADGVVEYAGWNSGGYGNMVDINHGNGIMTRYGHASQVLVTVGQYVHRGQLIAYMGSTGFSTGPHVHYEVHVNGQRVNPISYL